MNTIKTLSSTLITVLLVVLLAGCAPVAMPVHAEVKWEGANEGKFEDDPRVQIVREYVVQKHAADNAFNYSDPDFVEITSSATALSWARATADAIDSLPIASPDLWEGPPSFAVTGIEGVQDHEFAVQVCQRMGPRWTLSVGDTFEEGNKQERDGAYRIEQEHFVEHEYWVSDALGSWRITSEGASSQECEPTDDVAVGTYTTPPDIDLLHEATPDMVRGPDGKRVAE